MELVKVKNSCLVVKYNGHCSGNLIHFSEAFVTIDCFSISLLFGFHDFFLISSPLSLLLFPIFPLSSLFFWLLTLNILSEQSHDAYDFHHHTFQTHLSSPYHCLSSRSIHPTTCWFFFWMFHSHLSFSKIELMLSPLSPVFAISVKRMPSILPSKLDGPWLLFSFPLSIISSSYYIS